ncbi:MAG: GIY-YIG nuclease family protein [Patescibacteria group bacterium]
MKGYVYILKDDNGKFYIGSSKNTDERYKRHLSGFVFTTHRMKNPKIVLVQEYDSIEVAIKIERKLKKLKRKDYIEKIVKDGYIKVV